MLCVKRLLRADAFLFTCLCGGESATKLPALKYSATTRETNGECDSHVHMNTLVFAMYTCVVDAVICMRCLEARHFGLMSNRLLSRLAGVRIMCAYINFIHRDSLSNLQPMKICSFLCCQYRYWVSAGIM